MTDPRQAAADLLAAMTNDEFAAFAAEARTAPPAQLTRAELAGMTPDAIVAARDAGQLADVLGVPREEAELLARAGRLAPITRAELARLTRMGRPDLAAAYAAHPDRITT